MDDTLIPTGELAPVEGTPFDFRKATAIGARINHDHPQLKAGKGYDHNWVLNRKGTGADARRAALRSEERPDAGDRDDRTGHPVLLRATSSTGRSRARAGTSTATAPGLCLETQHYPDSPNKKNFPTTILQPGKVYTSKTVMTFSAK